MARWWQSKGEGKDEGMGGDAAKTRKTTTQMSSQKTPPRKQEKETFQGRKQFGQIPF